MATTRSDAARFIGLEQQYGANNYHPLDVVIQRAEGVWVWDVEGNKYLDFLAAYSAVNQGHCHPRIRRALVEQSERVTLTSRAFRNDQLGPLYKQMHDLSGYQRMLPMNSGAEAVETAIKASRKWGYTVKGVPAGRAEILVFKGNFHGRTTTIVGFSDEPQYREGFGPFTPGFTVLPYGDLAAIERAMNPNVVAVLVEPIQGESGIVVPPEGYLRGIEKLCREHRVLFVADEIQSGLGRTGKLFAFQHEGVRPDLVIVGKALAGGFYPVSAILADDEVMGVFRPGDHGSTFGGNPLACAVAREALRVLVEEKMIENSATLGAHFLARLKTLNDPAIKEVRGRGLWIGLELRPEAGGARRYCEALQRHGLLCKETHEHTIRFAPPLTIARQDLDWAFERVARVLGELGGARVTGDGPARAVETGGVTLYLAHPDSLPARWVGQREVLKQLLAAWSVVAPGDLPMTPRLLGKPGVGKTTLACAAARALDREVYIFQATMDTRPEDLLITPVVDRQGAIRYVASSLVTAMLQGGVAVLDEGNRMSEKAWASLAPLLDDRRYVESIVAGIKVRAHADFRLVATMNDDASTYELPEYIDSRLQPRVFLDFPEHDEEKRILAENLPFADDQILEYVTRFLQAAHAGEESFTVRDGVNVARYALKLLAGGEPAMEQALRDAVQRVLGDDALRHLGGGG